MRLTKKRAAEKVVSLMEDGLFDLLLREIKRDLATQIITTKVSENDKREELFMTVKAVELLDAKLLSFINQYNAENNE